MVTAPNLRLRWQRQHLLPQQSPHLLLPLSRHRLPMLKERRQFPSGLSAGDSQLRLRRVRHSSAPCCESCSLLDEFAIAIWPRVWPILAVLYRWDRNRRASAKLLWHILCGGVMEGVDRLNKANIGGDLLLHSVPKLKGILQCTVAGLILMTSVIMGILLW